MNAVHGDDLDDHGIDNNYIADLIFVQRWCQSQPSLP